MPRRSVLVDLPGGGTAIVCLSGGSKVKACATCGRIAGYACDMRRGDRPSGTCDAPICEQCRVPVGSNRDYCPFCAKLVGVQRPAELFSDPMP